MDVDIVSEELWKVEDMSRLVSDELWKFVDRWKVSCLRTYGGLKTGGVVDVHITFFDRQ